MAIEKIFNMVNRDEADIMREIRDYDLDEPSSQGSIVIRPE